MWVVRGTELVRRLSDRRSLVIKATNLRLYARGAQGDLLLGKYETIEQAKTAAQDLIASLEKNHVANTQ